MNEATIKTYAMQRNETVLLDPALRRNENFLDALLAEAAGKRVLNVGATGGVEQYLPSKKEIWLHEKLARVANRLIGIDVDEESIEYASNHGYEIHFANCENCALDEVFDVIVLSDVIEHINAPVYAIENLAKHLASDGKIFLSTPNLTHYGLLIRAWLGKQTGVYYDHVMGFLPEHLQALCERIGLRLTAIGYFSHNDLRTRGTRIKSAIARTIGKFVPRAHSSMYIIIERRVEAWPSSSTRKAK